MNKLVGIALILAGVSLAAGAPPIVVFDDANGTGWSRPWWTQTQTGTVYSGSAATLSTNGQTTFNHAGLDVGTNVTLDTWVNTLNDAPGGLHLQISYTDGAGDDHSSIPFDDRGAGPTYYLDDVEYTDVSDVVLDADSSTWQHLVVDITQPAYTGWPWVEHVFDPTVHVLTKIAFRPDHDSGYDGTLMVFDDVTLISDEGPQCHVGDANGDGEVGIADLSALADNYGVTSVATWQMGDFNDDGEVGIADLSALADNYGWIGDPCDPDAMIVPEPVTMCLLAVGGLALIRRRR